MQRRSLFTAAIVLAACSGAPPAPAPPVQIAPPVDAALPPGDTAPAAPPPSARGGACADTTGCAAGLTCLPASLHAPGGYCASECTACDDGACVPTARHGAVCLQRCTADADCRAREGYVCDPQWHACAVPNALVIALRTCPAPARIPAHDPAFGAPRPLAAAAPVAVLAPTATGGITTLPATDARPAPSLARDRKGILYAAWLAPATREAEAAVWLQRSRDGGTTWSEPDRADDPADCAGRGAGCLGEPTVVVGPNPEARGDEVVYVLYGAADGLRVRASRDEGATFRAAVTALPGTIASAEVAADGALHVIAIDSLTGIGVFGSANHRILYTVSRDVGRTFRAPQRLDRRDEVLPVAFARPQLAVDTRRKTLHALYVRGGRDGVWDLVVLASRDAGATWKRTRIADEPACTAHLVPQLALDPTRGTLHVAWYDTRGGGRFAHASCTLAGASAPACTQLGAISTAPVRIGMERQTPTSLGDRATLLVDDKRRALHAVWAEPGADGQLRVSHATARLR